MHSPKSDQLYPHRCVSRIIPATIRAITPLNSGQDTAIVPNSLAAIAAETEELTECYLWSEVDKRLV